MHLHHNGGSVRGAPLDRVRPAKMCPSGGMVDALDSKSCSERSARSSRAWGTIFLFIDNRKCATGRAKQTASFST